MGKHSHPEGEKDRVRVERQGHVGRHRDNEVRDDKGNRWDGGPVGDQSGRRAHPDRDSGEMLGGRDIV